MIRQQLDTSLTLTRNWILESFDQQEPSQQEALETLTGDAFSDKLEELGFQSISAQATVSGDTMYLVLEDLDGSATVVALYQDGEDSFLELDSGEEDTEVFNISALHPSKASLEDAEVLALDIDNFWMPDTLVKAIVEKSGLTVRELTPEEESELASLTSQAESYLLKSLN